MFKPISRKQVIFTDEHIEKIVAKFRMFEQGEPEDMINEVGFAKVTTIEEVAKNGYVLTPGRYVGIKEVEDETSFEEKMSTYSEELSVLLEEDKELTRKIREIFDTLGFKLEEK